MGSLKLLLLIISVNYCVGNIVVINKLNRKTVAEVNHKLLISELNKAQHKVNNYFALFLSVLTVLSQQMRLQVSNSTNSCCIAEPDESNALHSRKHHQRSVILLSPNDPECEISYRIWRAKDLGYSGIIFYSDSIHNFRKKPPIRGFHASVVSSSDGCQLAEYSGSLLDIFLIGTDDRK